MSTVLIGVLTYKQGLHDKYFYLASDGQWLLSADQTGVDNIFNPKKIIAKKKTLKRQFPLWIEVLHFIKTNEGLTVAEISKSLNFFVPQVAPTLTRLRKRGKIKKTQPRRCSISNHSSSSWVIA
tara:strand:+ start:414 stop:785 length:372 start_codon:yes stop_codon:yes gene_type:complete